MFPEPIHLNSPRAWVVAIVLGLLALLPAYASIANEPFYLTLFTRIMIFALAATSLNLLLGYAGMVSLGQALFVALGAYAVGILSFHGIGNGWIHLLAALLVSAVVALATGLVCLRTSGLAFIMITLAFAQMFYFLAISLKQYGGDDGMRLDRRSDLWPLDLSSNVTLYYVVFAILLAWLYLCWRLAHARFGYVLRGIRTNERRMKALGFDTLRYKLTAYVIAAMVAAVAGVLLANLTSYVSPSYGAWTVSGDLIVVVVLGGMGTVFGPVVGSIALLLFEEAMSSLTVYWLAAVGLLVLAVITFARRGLYGSLAGGRDRVKSQQRAELP